MRLHFTLSPNTEPVGFDYQHLLTGVFHKWLGQNDLHDKISLYSLGNLSNGWMRGGKLEFPKGASWFVSFYEEQYAEKLVGGALDSPEVFGGMRVVNIRQQATPDFGSRYRFVVGSPVLAKGKMNQDGKVPYYFYDDPEADRIITATLRHKMDKANERANAAIFTDEHKQVAVRFDREFPRAKTKLVNIKGTKIKASVCPVIVEGAPEAVQFAWNVGVGNGTGSGLGSLL